VTCLDNEELLTAAVDAFLTEVRHIDPATAARRRLVLQSPADNVY
jgi:hypothetical protein